MVQPDTRAKPVRDIWPAGSNVVICRVARACDDREQHCRQIAGAVACSHSISLPLCPVGFVGCADKSICSHAPSSTTFPHQPPHLTPQFSPQLPPDPQAVMREIWMISGKLDGLCFCQLAHSFLSKSHSGCFFFNGFLPSWFALRKPRNTK